MPASTVNRTVRVVFTALLLDILAFTIILPLFPRLLQHYRDIESGTEVSAELCASRFLFYSFSL